MTDLFNKNNDHDFQDTIRKLFSDDNEDEYIRDENEEDDIINSNNNNFNDDNESDQILSEDEETEGRSKIEYTIRPRPKNTNGPPDTHILPPSDSVNMLRFAVPQPFKTDIREFETAKQDKQIVLKNVDQTCAKSVLEGCPVCCEMNPKNKHFEVVREIFAIEHYYRCVIKDDKLFNVLVHKHQQLVENECESLSVPYYKWTVAHLRYHFSKCIQSNSRIFMNYFNANHKIIQDMRKRGVIRTRDNITGNYVYNLKEWIQLQNMQRALILDIKRHRKDELSQTIIDAPDGIAVSNMGVSAQKNKLNASTFVSAAVKRRVNMTQKQAPIGSRMIYEQYMHKT